MERILRVIHDLIFERGVPRGQRIEESREPRPSLRHEARRSSAPVDPFFERPYEAQDSVVPPAWDEAVNPASGVRSPNIRVKKKVAALLGGVKA